MATPVDDAPLPAAGAFRPATVRGVERFFRAGQDTQGRWWLIDPAGAPFFAKAVHGVRAAAQKSEAPVPPDSAVRLRRWGFNAVGVGGDRTGRDDGLAFLAVVDFCRTGAQIVGPGVRLPDVFAPDWSRVAMEQALSVCAPLARARELLGWVTDDAPGWAQPSPGHRRPSLLQFCLSLEPGFATYHAAWEFALASHGGNLDAMAKAWGVALANKEVLREFTRAETGIVTRGYLRDEARWTREFARRYFTTTAAAIRAADPNHLVFGCRYNGPVGAHVLAECVYPAVDVALPDWSELPPPDLPAGPMLAGNFGWAEKSMPPRASHLRQAYGGQVHLRQTFPRQAMRKLTSVERMLRRGRIALEHMARHPGVAGYVWGQWQDEPGEQPPFAGGLIHLNGTEAREHTELLAQFNARADALRSATRVSNLP